MSRYGKLRLPEAGPEVEAESQMEGHDLNEPREDLLGSSDGTRPDAMGAEERLAFLAKASDVLGASLDYETTLNELADLIIPRLADWYSVDLMDDPDSIRNVAVAHFDPEKLELARELQRRYPSDPHATTGLPQVVRTGRSELYTEIPESLIVEAAVDEEHLRLIRALGLRSGIVVPLTARGRTFGTLTLVTAESGRQYTEADVPLVEEIGERAALAIDNARLFEAERRASDRLALLSRVSELLAASLDYPNTFARLARLLVGEVADLCLIDVMEEEGAIFRVAAAHADPAKQPLADRLRTEYAPRAHGPHPVSRVLQTGRSEFSPVMTEQFLRETTRDEEHFRIVRELGFQSFMCVPLVARGYILGTVTLVSTRPDRRYGEDDLRSAEEIGTRAGVHIDNARLYDREHEIASMLQRSLLPSRLPVIPGIDVAARFHAAGEGVEVGGDFYDLYPLDDQRWAIVVGDVCGRGPEAAALTSMARYSIRTLALLEETPSQVLRGVNRTMVRSGVDRFCTLVLGVIRPGPAGATLTVARGGHPAPLVLRSGGRVESLHAKGTLVGVFDDPSFDDSTVDLAPGEALILFTDGLIERNPFIRDRGALSALLAECARSSAEEIAQRVDKALEEGLESLEDDVALLVIRVNPSQGVVGGV
jgi:GAF domain-containing protein